MRRYVFDSSALLRWLEDGPGGVRVEDLISRAGIGDAQVAISAVNWGEVYYVLARKHNEAEADRASADVRNLPIEITHADYSRAERAGSMRNKFSLSYADAFAAALAESNRATLVTADYDFKRVADAVSVEFLPAKKH